MVFVKNVQASPNPKLINVQDAIKLLPTILTAYVSSAPLGI